MSNKTWAEELKKGDPVINYRGRYGQYWFDKVERTTKTLIITKQGSRFNKVTLIERTGRFYSNYLRENTHENIEKARIYTLKREITAIGRNLTGTDIFDKTIEISKLKEARDKIVDFAMLLDIEVC